MKYIDKLTPEQEALMPAWRDEGIAKGLRCGDADWERFERGIRVAYQKADIPFPENIIRVQSPMVGAFAAAYAELLLRSGSVQDSIYNAITETVTTAFKFVIGKDAIRSATRNIGAEVNRAILPGHYAVSDSIQNAVGEAIHKAIADAVDEVTDRVIRGDVGDTVQVASAVVRSLDTVHIPVQHSVHTALRAAIDASVNAAVSDLISSVVQYSVFNSVDDPVGVAIDNVDNPIRDAVYGTAQVALRDAVNGAVRAAVSNLTDPTVRRVVDDGLNDPLSFTISMVDDPVRRAVYDAVENAVRNAVHIDGDGMVSEKIRFAILTAVPVAVSGAVSGDVLHTAIKHLDLAVSNVVNGTALAVVDAVEQAINGDVADAIDQTLRRGVGRAMQEAVAPDVYSQSKRLVVSTRVGDNISTTVKNTIRNILRTEKISWHYWLGGQFWIGGWWGGPVYVSFFREVCGLELPNDIAERADAYQDICESVNYVWPNRNFVMVCDRPKHIRRDDEGRLSCDQGQAIEYKDGWGLYALDGVVLEKELWTKIVSKTMTFTEIMQIENADHQAVALKYNPEAILTAGATCIDKSDRGNELYLVKNTDLNTLCDEPQMYFLKMRCPTGRTFIEGVDPEYAKQNPYADHCQAYAFGLTPTTYGFLRQEG